MLNSIEKQLVAIGNPIVGPTRLILRLTLCAIVLVTAFGANVNYCVRATQAYQAEDSGYRQVYVNRVRLSDYQVKALERLYQARLPDGGYWYDRFCGAWGFAGGPAAGFIHAGLNLGGRLRADASNGKTGVFVNGRELHRLDVLALQQLTPVYRGRYSVDARGSVWIEGGPYLGNLVGLAKDYGLLSGGGRSGSVTSGMYDSGIGRVLGNGDFFISGDTSWSR